MKKVYAAILLVASLLLVCSAVDARPGFVIYENQAQATGIAFATGGLYNSAQTFTLAGTTPNSAIAVSCSSSQTAGITELC